MYAERVVCWQNATSLTLQQPALLSSYTHPLVSQLSCGTIITTAVTWFGQETTMNGFSRRACKFVGTESLPVQSCEPSVLITWRLRCRFGCCRVNTTAIGCGYGVAAEMLFRAAALGTAVFEEHMHAVVMHGGMVANACCKPVPKRAIGGSPTAPQTHLLDILRFDELYVKTGQGRVRNRKVR